MVYVVQNFVSEKILFSNSYTSKSFESLNIIIYYNLFNMTFILQGVTVKPGPGVLLANQSLVLQRVSRKAAGAYVCTARNSLGEGSSERLILDVKCEFTKFVIVTKLQIHGTCPY